MIWSVTHPSPSCNRFLWGTNRLIVVVVVYWLLFGNSEVCKLTPFLFLTPTNSCCLFVYRSFKGIKDRMKKTRIWGGVTSILWCGNSFRETLEIVRTHSRKGVWRTQGGLSLANYKLRILHVYPCSVRTFERCCY